MRTDVLDVPFALVQKDPCVLKSSIRPLESVKVDMEESMDEQDRPPVRRLVLVLTPTISVLGSWRLSRSLSVPFFCLHFRLSKQNPDPWYSAFHYSHPPLVERLQAMAALSDAKKVA